MKRALLGLMALGFWVSAGLAQEAAPEGFFLTSPELTHEGLLPADLKCSRDGGDGLSPPLEWGPPPPGTQSLAVVMQHYPRGTVPTRDAPSQYWLLWNIPADTRALARGNPGSIGDEGADKDERGTGYTPPCSPAGKERHRYTIWLFALNAPLTELPAHDAPEVDWTTMMAAMNGKIIGASKLTFLN